MIRVFLSVFVASSLYYRVLHLCSYLYFLVIVNLVSSLYSFCIVIVYLFSVFIVLCYSSRE